MSQVAEKPGVFAGALEKRPTGGPRWLDDLRNRGAAKFAALGVPTVRDEEWRFPHRPPLDGVDFAPRGAVSGAPGPPDGLAFTHPPHPPPPRHSPPHPTPARAQTLPA